MKTKSLFLLFILLASICVAQTQEDLFMPEDMISDGVSLTDGAYTTFTTRNGSQLNASNYGSGISSSAVYVGSMGYSEDNAAIYLNNAKFLATSTSGGKLKKVTVEWAGAAAGNTASGLKKSILQVYGRNSALDGSENRAAATTGATWIKDITYPGEGETSEIDIPSGYTHVLLIASKAQVIAFTGILIEWEPIVYYDITNTDPSHISLSKSKAEFGETVSMTITPSYGYELIGYDYGDTHVDLSAAECTTASKTVTFAMPAKNISVSATFRTAVERVPVDFYFFNSLSDMELVDPITIDEVELASGADTKTVYFLTDDIYNASTITYSIADESVAVLASAPVYNTKTGIGQVTLQGYKVGTTELTITTAQTAEFEESVISIVITVEPQQVILVTEYEGKAFAATTNLSSKDLDAQEIIIANGNVYYDPLGTYSLAAMTWNLEKKIVDEEDVYTLTNSSGEYLRAMNTTEFRFEDTYSSSRNWYIEDGIFKTASEKGIRYSVAKGKFTATSVNEASEDFAASTSAVSVISVGTVSEYTRTLTNGNFATMCLPYGVSPTFLTGVDVFNVVGKYMSGGNVSGIELEEETGVLVAGKPYVIQATASTLTAKYGEETVVSPITATGLVGNLSSTPLAVPDGCYGIASNKLRKVAGGKATVGQYKAYLDLSAVPVSGSSSAPGRRVLYAESSTNEENGENTATSLDDFLINATFINWNEPVYNTLGQQVGKGTTGVLIQNGQKFLVQ